MTKSSTSPALPQHLEALEKANVTRFARAGLRRELRGFKGAGQQEAGRVKLAAVLMLPATDREVLASMFVVDLLRWVPSMYARLARRYASAAWASEHTTVGALTDRQREKLAYLLEHGLGAVREAEDENEVARWAAERNAA